MPYPEKKKGLKMTSSKEKKMCEEGGFTEHLSRGVFVTDKNNIYWLNTRVKEKKVKGRRWLLLISPTSHLFDSHFLLTNLIYIVL